MYFTRFPINKTRRAARSMLASPYRMHAALAGSFPPDGAQAPGADAGRVLWRVEATGDGSACLYIVSPTVPSLIGLDEQIGWPDMPGQWETRDYEPFLERINVGQTFSFRLVANPSVNRSKVTGANGRSKRIGHLTIQQQMAWLVGKDAYAYGSGDVPELFKHQNQSRAERNGFEVVSNDEGLHLVVSNSRKQSFKRGESGKEVTLVTAQYDGIMRVTDTAALKRALIGGIGHAKGFGCGLLTIAPIAR